MAKTTTKKTKFDDKKTIIKVEGVHKTFKVPKEKTTSLKSKIVNPFGKKGYEEFHVLNDINLEIKEGEFFGIVGRNGSGKSTLLKIISGIYSHDEGSVEVNGKLTPFIELGVGFNPELTGRDNVFLNGALLGFTRSEMAEMYDDIVAFAGLKKFMDQSLKNYSSGMQVRLAFSIAIRAQSPILILDEVLAVGDANFQKKCLNYFDQVKGKRTVVLVSHDMKTIKKYCDRVMVLEDSEMLDVGPAEDVVLRYSTIMANEELKVIEKKNEKGVHIGNGKASITKAYLKSDGKKVKQLKSGKPFSIEVEFDAKKGIEEVGALFSLFNNKGQKLFSASTGIDDVDVEVKQKGNKLSLDVKKNLLGPGLYRINVGIFDNEVDEPYDQYRDAIEFTVEGTQKLESYVAMDYSWKAKK